MSINTKTKIDITLIDMLKAIGIILTACGVVVGVAWSLSAQLTTIKDDIGKVKTDIAEIKKDLKIRNANSEKIIVER